MPRRDPKVRLLHMRDYARKAVAMIEGQTRDDLDSDEKLRLALTHLVELVGEAASKVPVEVQSQYPEIPWPKVISMRHRLIHGKDIYRTANKGMHLMRGLLGHKQALRMLY